MRSSLFQFGLLAAIALPVCAQSVQLPPDSPLSLLSTDFSQTKTAERGGASVMDVRADLVFRNLSQRKIRGITLSVVSQQVAPGGKASVTKASLDIAAGENLPVKIDLRLLRPLGNSSQGAAVEVTLDGVLFDDLSFFGPNKLDSRRVLTAWEMEAQRDRKFFAQVLAAEGENGLKREALASLERQADTPRLDMHYARAERATATTTAARSAKLAFLAFPDSPVEALNGSARITSDVSLMPKLDIVNRSKRPVKSLEVGWIIKDASGKEFLAGSLPSQKTLAPGARAPIGDEAALSFTSNDGAKVAIGSMDGSIQAFINQVEFADGSVWIPSRGALADAQLRRAMPPSPEEQRLTGIYKRRGLPALKQELKKFE